MLAWCHDEAAIRSFLTQLHAILEPLGPVIVYLDGDPADALRRAATSSGDVWLHDFLAKVTNYKTTPPIADLAGTVAHLRRERDVTLEEMRDAGYVVVVLRNADARAIDELATEALSHLGWVR